MEEVTAGVCLVSIKRSRYSAVYGGGHAKTAFLHAAISAAAHQNFISFTNVQFGICYDERSELVPAVPTTMSTTRGRPFAGRLHPPSGWGSLYWGPAL